MLLELTEDGFLGFLAEKFGDKEFYHRLTISELIGEFRKYLRK